jgi:hypothetical protein
LNESSLAAAKLAIQENHVAALQQFPQLHAKTPRLFGAVAKKFRRACT